MPTMPMFFGNAQESGESVLAGGSPLAINVLVDGKGAVRRRPGLSAWSGFPSTIPVASRVDGISEFGDDVYWVNAARSVYRLNVGGASAANLSPSGGTQLLDGNARPMFATTRFRLVMTGGGFPQKVDTGAALAARLGGSPPQATQVIALAQRLYLDDLTDETSVGKIRISGAGMTGEETWDAIDVASAEARPDSVQALSENANEAFVFGDSTLQVFSPDPVTILTPGRAVNRGIGAPHSVIKSDEDLAWFTDRDQFVIGDGRSTEVLSDSISSTLETIVGAEDMWGFRLNMDQFDCLVWVCPTDGRAFCYQAGGGWSQWHTWTGAGHGPLAVKSHHLYTGTNTHIAGLATGQIVKFDSTAGTDMGSVIKAEVRTGFQNRDTDAHKHCKCVLFTFKRGHSTSTEPFVLLSWRDDLGDFCDPIRLGLGTTGDNVFTIPLRSLGSYRRREWKMEFTDAADFVLAGAEETFSIDKEGD
jgi:hypothetical protein